MPNPPLVVTIPHELGRAEARRRIEAGVQRLAAQVGAVGEVTQAWRGDTLAFSMLAIGQTVRGTIDVADREVRLEIVLPGIFAMVAGGLRGRLRDEGQRLLAGPARAP